MTPGNTRHRVEEDRHREKEEDKALGGGGGAAMRVIVPLQGVLQGRAGVVMGSVIPCALFYFLQLYLRRHRSPPQSPASPRLALSENPPSRTQSSLRSLSRPALASSRMAVVAGGNDSAYYAGWAEYLRNPYDAESNPEGVIQLGLAESQLSLDLIEDWLTSHPEASSWEGISDKTLSLRGVARYQEDDGLPPMKANLSRVMVCQAKELWPLEPWYVEQRSYGGNTLEADICRAKESCKRFRSLNFFCGLWAKWFCL